VLHGLRLQARDLRGGDFLLTGMRGGTRNAVPAVHRPVLSASGCKHVVTTPDPESTHDLMEQHYAAEHQREIDKMVGGAR